MKLTQTQRNWVFNILAIGGTILSFIFPEWAKGPDGVQLAIWPALIAAGAAIGSALIGKAKGDSDRDAANKAIQAAVDELTGVGIPPVQAQELALKLYESQGEVTPAIEHAAAISSSDFDNIKQSPQYKEASLRALDQLRQTGESGGMNLTDRANLEQVLSDVGATDRGRREAILSRMASRGQLGSGLELTAQLQNAQDASQTSHMAGLRSAADASQRALDAIRQGGELGMSLGNQEWGQQAQAASARDAIAKFNAEAANAAEARNVARRQDTQNLNLQNKQNLANQNVDLQNKQQIYNKELLQKEFDNKMRKAQAVANAYGNQSQQSTENADRTGSMWAGIGSAGAQLGGALQNYQGMLNQNEQNALDRDAYLKMRR